MTKLLKVGDTLKVKEKLTSLELLEQINIFRKQDGKQKPMRHHNLLVIIRDEFEEEINDLKIQAVNYKDKKGEMRPMFNLTLDQSKQVLVRESKFVRKAVIAYINKLESQLSKQLPQTYAEALRAYADEVEQKELAIKQRDYAIRTKAEIGERREATAMNTASQLSKENKKLKIEVDRSKDYATITTVEKLTKKRYRWQELRNYCNAHELDMPKVADKRYGTVRTYPAEAWLNVYGIDLKNC